MYKFFFRIILVTICGTDLIAEPRNLCEKEKPGGTYISIPEKKIREVASNLPAEIAEKVRLAMKKGQKIEAVKLVRFCLKTDLRSSKLIVENL